MDCLIKHSLSYVLENIIKKLIENANSYAHLMATDDWRLLISLNESVVNNQICENQCLGCLEFSRMVSMFSNFTKGIFDASKENKDIVTELRVFFDIPEECHPVTLALDLVAAPEYVKSKISEESIPAYKKYVDAVRGEVTRLALDHFLHEQAKCTDAIISYGNLEREQIISYMPAERTDDKEVFYVDQNIISKYGSDPNLKLQIENFKNKVNCRFVYSPYVIEDGVKMSRVRLAEYFESVKALTDSTMLVQSEEGLSLAIEDIRITFDRVLLWRNATRAAEDLKIHKIYFNQWRYPHYARNSRFSKRANENIGEFLEFLRPHLEDRSVGIDIDDFESDRALCRMLCAATIEKSFSLQELVDRSIKHESDAECIEHIGNLCDFLDLINYQTESLSDLNKVRSSLQDAEHLKHAWKADYFVTDDQRLRARGKFIYSVLGLKARFIKLNDLKGMIANAFKSA